MIQGFLASGRVVNILCTNTAMREGDRHPLSSMVLLVLDPMISLCSKPQHAESDAHREPHQPSSPA